MPHLTLQISANGPVVDLDAGVTSARARALRRAKHPVPAPVRIRGLIDTGASGSCIDPSIVSALNLSPTGTAAVVTPSTGASPHYTSLFDVSLILVHPNFQLKIDPVAMMEAHLTSQGIQALIGRDVLEKCLLVYDGAAGTFSLAF